MPQPAPAALAGKLLLVGSVNAGAQADLQKSFAHIEKVAQLTRNRGPLIIEEVELDVLEAPTGDVLDRTPPPELAR